MAASNGQVEQSGDDGGKPDLDTIAATATAAEPAKPRGGWPKGKPRGPRGGAAASGTASAKTAAKLDLTKFTAGFVSLHYGLAAALKIPELQVSPEEAHEFLRLWGEAARHFDVQATQKSLDLMAAAMFTASMYGGRAVMMVSRREAERRQRTGAVIPLHPAAGRQQTHQRPPQAPAGDRAPANFGGVELAVPPGPMDDGGQSAV